MALTLEVLLIYVAQFSWGSKRSAVSPYTVLNA